MLAGSIRHQDECLRRRCGVSCMELSTQEACVCACVSTGRSSLTGTGSEKPQGDDRCVCVWDRTE